MLGKSFLRNGICVAIVVGLTVIATSCDKKETTSFPTIEIGWQVAWATQGQIAMALQRTTALETMRLKGDFKSFTYGAPMSEVALAGQLDVAFVGDQPAVSLLSRSTDWKIVARLMDFRVAIVVSPASSIQTVADLKGKTLGIPFGASTHRVALEMLKEAGLDPDKDLKIINIDILEQSDVVKAAAGCPWPKVDAFASWDHHIALYEKQGYARILKSGTALGVVIMSQKFIESKPKEAAKFLAAFKLAYLYYATHQEEVDRWFAEAAGGKFDVSILKTVAEVESNMKAPDLSHVRIDIGTRQITTLQQAADFAFAQGLIKQPLSIQNAVTTAVLQEAEKLINPPTQLTIGVHEKNQ
jgi:ABC-type nitrate/sulfonate/bicarbonate transport system substrate-binding protein